MRQESLLLPAVAFFLAVTAAAHAQPTAEALLERSNAYHDPHGKFLTEPHRLRFLETRPGGADQRSEVTVDVAGERFEVRRSGDVTTAGFLGDGRCEMTLDGRSDLTDEEREKHRLTCGGLQRMRDYYTYLWGLPMKLADPGTRLGEVTETTFEGRDVYGLRVTYDEEVGRDTWYFYFDRESAALVGYRFYHDESKNDGEYIVLDGEVESEGLRLPKSRAWYTHADDRHLGTDILLAAEPER